MRRRKQKKETVMKRIILLITISVFSLSVLANGLPTFASNWDSTFQKDEMENELKIYPNPCKQEKLTIEFNNQQIQEIRITNIAGKEVLVKKFQFPENKKQIQLNDISNGIYLLRVKTEENKTVVKKLIVAKD